VFNAEGGIMLTIKNVRPGILIIPDAGLKLFPGEVAPVEEQTDQIKHCLQTGVVIQVDKEKASNASSQGKQDQDDDLSKLNATDAISKVNEEADPAKLKGYMEGEKRRTVIDALKNRLAEVDVDAS
jgi:hypothetical protein